MNINSYTLVEKNTEGRTDCSINNYAIYCDVKGLNQGRTSTE